MKIFRFVFWISLAATGLLGFIFPNPQPHFLWNRLPVYDAAFGFLGAFAIIFFAKALAHHWLQKKEDYYD
jgi:hypothetical protein